MNTPELEVGMRRLGDEELIKATHLYWNSFAKKFLTVRGSYIGKTLKWLIVNSFCQKDRIIVEKSKYPVFEGWVGMGVDEPIQVGDVLVNLRPTKREKQKGEPTEPNKGRLVADYFAGSTLRNLYPLDKRVSSGKICVYRRISAIKQTKIRRFPPGQYANPLPLP